jgi:uncharacterized protein YndB with AHSA1/START domain
MSATDETSIKRTLTVNAPIERCFKVFTEGFDSWWPRSHHIGAADMKVAILEGKPGGRWYERGVDGSECDWGKVLAYEPPHRLVVTWQLDSEFTFDPDEAHASEVEVRFVAVAPRTTLVELEHRHIDRSRGDWRKMVQGVSGEGGWASLLQGFGKEAEALAA